MQEKEYLKLLGKRISEQREKTGLSGEELGEKVKLTRMHIYRIEKGLHSTSITALLRISMALEIELKELVDF
jgi:transcriptional regulator with XRE-family HTH domain